jgi:hypothetical protein
MHRTKTEASRPKVTVIDDVLTGFGSEKTVPKSGPDFSRTASE